MCTPGWRTVLGHLNYGCFVDHRRTRKQYASIFFWHGIGLNFRFKSCQLDFGVGNTTNYRDDTKFWMKACREGGGAHGCAAPQADHQSVNTPQLPETGSNLPHPNSDSVSFASLELSPSPPASPPSHEEPPSSSGSQPHEVRVICFQWLNLRLKLKQKITIPKRPVIGHYHGESQND